MEEPFGDDDTVEPLPPAIEALWRSINQSENLTPAVKSKGKEFLNAVHRERRLEGLRFFEYEDGALFFEWSAASTYCHLDPDGTFDIAFASPPDRNGEVPMKSYSATAPKEAMETILLAWEHRR